MWRSTSATAARTRSATGCDTPSSSCRSRLASAVERGEHGREGTGVAHVALGIGGDGVIRHQLGLRRSVGDDLASLEVDVAILVGARRGRLEPAYARVAPRYRAQRRDLADVLRRAVAAAVARRCSVGSSQPPPPPSVPAAWLRARRNAEELASVGRAWVGSRWQRRSPSTPPAPRHQRAGSNRSGSQHGGRAGSPPRDPNPGPAGDDHVAIGTFTSIESGDARGAILDVKVR
jgi:hypothetical protein